MKPFSPYARVKCEACHGTGFVFAREGKMRCLKCRGVGSVRAIRSRLYHKVKAAMSGRKAK